MTLAVILPANLSFDPNLPLELLNGAGMVIELCFLICMVRYLWKEARIRKLGVTAWVRWQLPPSMNFVAAVVIFDGGVWIRSVVIWAWRRFDGAADFSVLQVILLGLGAIAIVWGSLCKIRAITKPDLGDGPWLTAAALTFAFVVWSVYFH